MSHTTQMFLGFLSMSDWDLPWNSEAAGIAEAEFLGHPEMSAPKSGQRYGRFISIRQLGTPTPADFS